MADSEDREQNILTDSSYMEFAPDGEKFCIKVDLGRLHDVEDRPMTKALYLEEFEEIQLLKILRHRQDNA